MGVASQRAIEAMLARRASHRSMFERGVYRVACPKCGAPAGESCRRPDGERRPAHLTRLDVEDPQEVLFT
jgi:hypothetical protein